MPITCTFSRPGKKASARGKNLAASQTLLIRRRHFLLHRHHLPSAVFPRPQDTPLGSRHKPRSQAPAPSTTQAPIPSLPPAHSPTARIPLFCLTSSALPSSQEPSNRRPPLPPDATKRHADHAPRALPPRPPLPRFRVPQRRPGPTPMAVSSQAPPPASPQQTLSCSQASGATTHAPPLSQTRRSTHKHFPAPPVLSLASHSPAPTAVLRTSAATSPTVANAPTVSLQSRLCSQPCLTSFRRPAVDALAHSRRSRSGAAGSQGPAPLRVAALGPRPQPPHSLRPPPSPFALLSQLLQLEI